MSWTNTGIAPVLVTGDTDTFLKHKASTGDSRPLKPHDRRPQNPSKSNTPIKSIYNEKLKINQTCRPITVTVRTLGNGSLFQIVNLLMDINYFDDFIEKRPKFESYRSSELDIYTKRAALKIAPSVVALVSYSGEEELCQGCDTIIEVDNNNNSVVITSANLVRRPTREYIVENNLADNLKVHVVVAEGKSYKGEIVVYDFHYNILVLRFQSSLPLPAARIARITDSLSLSVTEEKPVEVRPHSRTLMPGDSVVAFARYSESPYDVMAAPGFFSMDRCELDCKELCLATCIIDRCDDGGPLINLCGEVIGVTYYELSHVTPFLPINIVLKWWEHYKSHGKCCHPSLGFEATNLHAADLCIIERVLKRFPNICKGVIVEKDDVIIQCGNQKIESFLELLEMLWERVNDSMELVVARANHDTLIHLKLTATEAKPEDLNSWPRWD